MFSYEYTLLRVQFAGILVLSYEPILLKIHFNKLCADYLEQKCGVRSPVFADKHKNAGK